MCWTPRSRRFNRNLCATAAAVERRPKPDMNPAATKASTPRRASGGRRRRRYGAVSVQPDHLGGRGRRRCRPCRRHLRLRSNAPQRRAARPKPRTSPQLRTRTNKPQRPRPAALPPRCLPTAISHRASTAALATPTCPFSFAVSRSFTGRRIQSAAEDDRKLPEFRLYPPGQRRRRRSLQSRGDGRAGDLERLARLIHQRVYEQLTLNQRVQGSIPCAPTNDINNLAGRSTDPQKGVSAMCPHLHGRLGVDLVSEHQNYEFGGREFESLRARQINP